MYRLNYPVQTPEAIAFWGSKHKCNTAQAIIAFSLDLDNANDNLRRFNYKLFWRKRALNNFGHLVNQPDMNTSGFNLYTLNDRYWHCMPINPVSGGSLVPTTFLTPTTEMSDFS